ncbi:DUF4255 domain-containing protein [Spirulina subsalsa FACHB-351]|uniref:DUF4255 domain-containing protein n=1 Tax=Spirulina subsalsa FACHB-351 TaxID=234711 RepID=A0ABT3L6P1_9CYAN|nr:DUF4255 domain-containing protein [Spirulina subsalsa]MCW6037173.1 DUF4255 domain-containing protein [Spirulina subsalsa FACHB-351]
MLDDLDSSLKRFFIYGLPDLQNQSETSVSLSFVTPLEGEIQQKPAINLFLYDVRENLELRRGDWTMERQANGTAIKIQPPARINCSYLITVWVNGDDPQEEHHLLSQILKLLLHHPVLPPELLIGSLRDQDYPVLLKALQPGYLQGPGEFWQALGGRPKLSLHCMATIAIPIEKETGEWPLVLENQPRLSRLS